MLLEKRLQRMVPLLTILRDVLVEWDLTSVNCSRPLKQTGGCFLMNGGGIAGNVMLLNLSTSIQKYQKTFFHQLPFLKQ